MDTKKVETRIGGGAKSAKSARRALGTLVTPHPVRFDFRIDTVDRQRMTH